MLRLTMDGKLFLAPLGPKPGRILDIGTGTGIWAIDVGDEYPSAEIIGTDLSPTQPSWSASLSTSPSPSAPQANPPTGSPQT